MPTGDDLLPFDPKKPPKANPQGVAVVGNKAYVTLNNLGTDYAGAGPALLLVVDVRAWTKDKLIVLSGKDAKAACPVRENKNLLWVSTAGTFLPETFTYQGDGVVEVLDVTEDKVVKTIESGGAPGVLSESGSGIIWATNLKDGSALRFDLANEKALEPLSVCPSDQTYNFVADVAGDGKGLVYLACFGTDQIKVIPETGETDNALILDVGDGPTSLLVVPQ